MRWEGQRESSNVEDRRGQGGGMGRGMPMPGGRGGVGLGTIVIALLGAWFFGINPMTVIDIFGGGGAPMIAAPEPPSSSAGQRTPGAAPADQGGKFVSVVLASTEDTWRKVFATANAQYPPPKLVLYSGRTSTACGLGDMAAGPFYCPADQKVYIDLSFYKIMRDRLGAAGDAAQAYVIAHEVGHHVQNVIGTMQRMEQARQRMSQQQYNQLSVRLELQADCYAGVWVHHSQQAKGWLEQGDIEEAMQAAAAVGDDKIQREMQGVVRPESFTHGSSAQRVRWFKLGAESGRIDQCDTFAARQL